jgi:galactokinase
MWQLEQTPGPVPADLAQFLAVVNAQAAYFGPCPLYVGRAPGRLDLMGGIADYSGSLVLELPLALATYVAVQAIPESIFEIFSPEVEATGDEPLVRWPLSALAAVASGEATSLEASLETTPGQSWVNYAAGVWVMLQRAYELPSGGGVRLLVHSQVPAGKGVSSSAALEVATLKALAGLYSLDISGKEAAILCQKAENTIVGAPCGIMDQMTVACGQADHLLALRCQPAQLEGNLQLPAGLTVWGLDSGIRHAVNGSDYSSVRIGAFMGYRMVAGLAGLKAENQAGQPVRIEDPAWQGYLANLAPSLWETTYRDLIPVQLRGQDFLDKWGGTTDAVTRVDPTRTYAVRQSAAHPIYENHRVELFRALLDSQSTSEALKEQQYRLLGELMYQSHLSYSRCGLGSSGTDRLVELVRLAGPAVGLYGAKITGGGSGGTVAVLGRGDASAAVQEIANRYAGDTGYSPQIMGGSSPGAMHYPTLRLVELGT